MLLQRDPFSTMQEKANNLVTQLKNDNVISESTAKSLTIYNAFTTRFYTLPKIHKPNASMRPIVPSIDSHNSKLYK